VLKTTARKSNPSIAAKSLLLLNGLHILLEQTNEDTKSISYAPAACCKAHAFLDWFIRQLAQICALHFCAPLRKSKKSKKLPNNSPGLTTACLDGK
jgi:hypothetical protein